MLRNPPPKVFPVAFRELLTGTTDGGRQSACCSQLGKEEPNWTLYPMPPSLNCCCSRTRAVQRFSKYVPSNRSEGARNFSDKTVPVLKRLGLVITKPSLKTLSAVVEYSTQFEVKSRQEKLTGIANCEGMSNFSLTENNSTQSCNDAPKIRLNLAGRADLPLHAVGASVSKMK